MALGKERLQKILSRSGLASRRGAEKMILAGRISVNQTIIRELGSKAEADKDEIRLDGSLIYSEREKVYIMLNKPRGYVTTLHDPQKRPTVIDLLRNIHTRIFPVGRLDYDSQGLLLLTNDGEFSHKVLHPIFCIPKVYKVKIHGKLSKKELSSLKKGIELDDGIFSALDCQIIKVNNRSSWLTMTLTEGKNRIIRRALASLGQDVIELIRVQIGNVELGDLKVGNYRHLTKLEIKQLFSFSKIELQRNSKNYLD